MKGKKWIVLAIALVMGVPSGVLATHLAPGNPETVVTGHTVLASNVIAVIERPTDFAAIAGLAVQSRRNECVVWFNGIVIFDGTVGGDHNLINDNALDPCGKIRNAFMIMAIESGDCDPRAVDIAHIADVEFVRDLSFTDPNGQAHPVAEIRYSCAGGIGADGCALEFVNGDDRGFLDSCGDFLHTVDDLANDTVAIDPNFRSLFKEYVWVTTSHLAILDPTLDDGVCLFVDPADPNAPSQNFCSYNFAVMVDTCNDQPTAGNNARRAPGAGRCTDGGGEEFLTDGDPSNDQFAEPRFDDTPRALVVHAAEPATFDEIRDGNSNPDTVPCNNADDHREDKSVETGDPCDPFGETDYDPEEDHLSAQVDLLVSQATCLDVANQAVVQVFCDNLALLTPQVVNHPGCVSSHDAQGPGDPGHATDICWDPVLPPDDAAGVGGPRTGEFSDGNPYTGNRSPL